MQAASFKDNHVFARESERTQQNTGMLESMCSCEDVFDLERKLAKLQESNRDVTRRTIRLEHIMSDFVKVLQSSDDVALLERRTCSAMVYNEQLTTARPLRLLREELRILQHKWSL